MKKYLTVYFFIKLIVSISAWCLLREIEHGDLSRDRKLYYQHIHDILTIFCFSVNFLNCLVGVISSMVTFYRLCFHGNGDNLTLRSSVTIFLMNVPYIFSLVCNVVAVKARFQYGYYYASFIMLHMIISAYNPCVIIARTSKVQRIIWAVITGRGSERIYLGSGVTSDNRSHGNRSHENRSCENRL